MLGGSLSENLLSDACSQIEEKTVELPNMIPGYPLSSILRPQAKRQFCELHLPESSTRTNPKPDLYNISLVGRWPATAAIPQSMSTATSRWRWFTESRWGRRRDHILPCELFYQTGGISIFSADMHSGLCCARLILVPLASEVMIMAARSVKNT